jgi:hypothetical protein
VRWASGLQCRPLAQTVVDTAEWASADAAAAVGAAETALRQVCRVRRWAFPPSVSVPFWTRGTAAKATEGG